MAEQLNFVDVVLIGSNDTWRFLVARIDGGHRWVGLAAPRRSSSEQAFHDVGFPVSPQMLMILTLVGDGCEMGILDRDLAIRLVGAIAQNAEDGYGGIDTWNVPEDLRGHPNQFRCVLCDRVGCNGTECRDAFFDGGFVEV